MKAMNAMKKLKNRKGESLAETLIALLIAALGIVLLAGMIAGAFRIITRSKAAAEEYTAAENLIIAQGDGGVSGTVTINSAGSAVKLSDESTSANIGVVYYISSETSGNPAISYKVG